MTLKFIEKASRIHKDYYDYSKTIYTKRSEKVIIICPKHGEFIQSAGSHLNGRGCKFCGKERLIKFSKDNLNSLSEIIRRANIVHSHKYDYSESKYNGYHTKFTVICKEHGRFRPTPANHITNKTGCPKCAAVVRNQYLEDDFDTYVAKARKIHQDQYTYKPTSKTLHNRSSIIIICDKHGEHLISKNSHLNGRGCPECGVKKISDSLRLPYEEFLTRANELYDNHYKYLEESYNSTKKCVDVICPDHGNFTVMVASHLAGSKCPRCKSNLLESSIIKYVSTLGKEIKLYDRKRLKGKELDILIDDKIAIECHGLYWHSFGAIENCHDRMRHSIKHDLCKNEDIELLQIYENEWNNKQAIVKSIIKNKLRLSDCIYARKCEITMVSTKDLRRFLVDNHLQGYKAGIAYGLKYEGDLCCVLVMSRSKKYEWEIARYASISDITVVGGLSRLYKRFLSDYKPNSVVSYADRRYFNGSSYENIGMVLDGVTRPNYKYFKNKNLYSREKFQKHKLDKLLITFDKSKTEAENMFNNGYRRIWDAGNYRYLWKKKNI